MTYYRTKLRDSVFFDDVSLEKSYKSAALKSEATVQLDRRLVKNSANFFSVDNRRELVPKKLDVIALIYGLPFEKKLKKSALSFQRELDNFLQPSDRYWVPSEKLALELAVIKWPREELAVDLDKVIKFIKAQELRVNKLKVNGFQIHSDGCVVIRGYDQGKIRHLRKALLDKFPEFPRKQSSWAHIPLGRIIRDIPTEKLRGMLELAAKSAQLSAVIELQTIKLVHEKQWYMADIDILHNFKLQD